jgi:PhnB protein
MTRMHAYLNFNGNCEEAFKFYESVFNQPNLGIYRFNDMPADPNMPPMPEADKNKIMHIALKINEHSMLMGSDCLESFGQKAVPGTNTYIMLDTENADDAQTLYSKLSNGAQNIEMPLGEQPWAELYASFTDQFGIAWMIHFEGNKKY